jgi:trehalose 6-phosphate synthase
MSRLVVVSNRVPDLNAGAQAGGLAVALEDLMRRRGGLWFGWSGRVAESSGQAPRCYSHAGIDFATIDLNAAEHAGYYNGFSNSVLWPLLHSLPDLMAFDRRSAQVYREVNARMADTLLSLLQRNDLIWVHDYHLMSLPAMLRARGVRAPIGFFLHIPFPSADLLANAPESATLLRDLLAADLIGFQTVDDMENFAAAAMRISGAARLSGNLLQLGSRRVRLGVFPVEIEAREFATIAETSWHDAATERLRRSLQGQLLMLGVDRMDPTKGLPQRLAGFRRLLATHPEWQRQATFVQVAALSRQEVGSYRELRCQLDRDAGAINSEFGDIDWTPLRLVARAGTRAAVAGYMREARVGLVTPLRDGMNLVAKEFVAAQDPQNPGVLVLSHFAGAARQLTEALLVNPHDPDAMADAMHRALLMPLGERRERWQALWQAIAHATPLAWGRGFVAALVRAGAAATAPRLPVPGLAPVAGRLAPVPAHPIAFHEAAAKPARQEPPQLI